MKSIPILLLALTGALFLTAVQPEASAQTIASDPFNTNLSGGTGWVAGSSWNGGQFSNGQMLVNGGFSQTATRRFDGLTSGFTARPGENANGAAAGFYSIQYAIGFDINQSLTGNYGFRMFQGGNNNGGTFVGVWKNNDYGGSLTFLGANNTQTSIAPTLAGPVGSTFDVWNIQNAQNSSANGVSYTFTYDVSVLHGQNPDQYRGGTYNVQVARYVNGTLTHTTQLNNIGWRDGTNSVNAPNLLDTVTFQNTNNKTNVLVDNVLVSRSSLMVTPVPEPSSALLVLGTLAGVALVRRRPTAAK